MILREKRLSIPRERKSIDFFVLKSQTAKMSDHSSVEKILISVTEYERLKEIEQKYIDHQNNQNKGKNKFKTFVSKTNIYA
jgi:hypothetical protein